MTVQEAGEKARSYFMQGYNCSQSVFLVFAPQLGLGKDTAARLSQAFGGGICRMREVCGTMSGVLMASVGLMESIVGFTPEQIALLMTFYMALDGYGPAANVTGDGAIALVIDRFFGPKTRSGDGCKEQEIAVA